MKIVTVSIWLILLPTETESDVDILMECLKCQTKDFPGMKRSLLALASVFNSNGEIHFVSVLVQCFCRSMPACQSQNVYTLSLIHI